MSAPCHFDQGRAFGYFYCDFKWNRREDTLLLSIAGKCNRVVEAVAADRRSQHAVGSWIDQSNVASGVAGDDQHRAVRRENGTLRSRHRNAGDHLIGCGFDNADGVPVEIGDVQT